MNINKAGERILKLIEDTNPKNFGIKNWTKQPEYFEYIFKNIDSIESENDTSSFARCSRLWLTSIDILERF